MSKKTRITQLPGVPSDATPAQRQFLDAVKQAVELGEGVRGDPLDAKLTRRDLVEIGLANAKVQGRGLAGVGAGGVLEPREPPPNLTTPPRVSGFTAGGAFNAVTLSWGAPGYANHAYVEIWRAKVKDIGQATLVGTQASRIHIDQPGGGFDGYYWARNVSDAPGGGVKGPFSGPIHVETAPDHEAIRDSITATQWEPERSYGLFVAVSPTSTVTINGTEIRLIVTRGGITGATEPDWGAELTALGETVTDGSVIWQAVEAGKIPFLIDPETGLVVIEGAAMREASIEALKVMDGFFDQMTAAKGTLGEANMSVANIFNIIVGNLIQSDNWIEGSSGYRLRKNGDIELNNVTARGHIVGESGSFADSVVVGARTVSGVNGDIDTAQSTASTADSKATDAKNKTDSWTRPNTTKIDGNEIFTGDAYVDTLQIKGNAVTLPLSTNPSNFTPPTFGVDSEFDENFTANEFAEISFDTNDLSSARPVIVNVSFLRLFSFDTTISGVASAWHDVTNVEHTDPVQGTSYTPVRTYVRLELWRGSTRQAWRWLTFWQDHSVNVQTHWAPTVNPGYNYSLRALGSCEKSNAFTAIYMNMNFGLR